MRADLLAKVEEFLLPARRSSVTHELASEGGAALPVLRAVFDGSAVNKWGVPYAQFGECLSCALVVCQLLGPAASTLEAAVVGCLGHDSSGVRLYAANALAQMGIREDASVTALARCLGDTADVAIEAAATIVAAGVAKHPAVQVVVRSSPRAEALLRRQLANKA